MEVSNYSLRMTFSLLGFFRSDVMIIKLILRCLEIALGFKVNFHKSSLVGILV